VEDEIMNRSDLEQELKSLGVTLKGWMPVLQCDTCKRHWEPFGIAVGATAPTVRFDYWKCKNNCNADHQPSHALQTALPKYIVLNDVPGMIFGEGDEEAFEDYVRSMDPTEIPNRNF
jgi:hypothetical protein